MWHGGICAKIIFTCSWALSLGLHTSRFDSLRQFSLLLCSYTVINIAILELPKWPILMVCLSIALHPFPHSTFCYSLNKQLIMCSQFFISLPPIPLNHQGFRITIPPLSSFKLTPMLNKCYKGVLTCHQDDHSNL